MPDEGALILDIGHVAVALGGGELLCRGLLHQGVLNAIGGGDLRHAAVGIGLGQNGVDVGSQVRTLPAADAILLGGESFGVIDQVRVAGALAGHGGCHEQVDDGGIGGTGVHFHQGVGLGGHRGELPALLGGHRLAGAASLHGVDQVAGLGGVPGVGGFAGGIVLAAAGQEGAAHSSCQKECKCFFHGVLSFSRFPCSPATF